MVKLAQDKIRAAHVGGPRLFRELCGVVYHQFWTVWSAASRLSGVRRLGIAFSLRGMVQVVLKFSP